MLGVRVDYLVIGEWNSGGGLSRSRIKMNSSELGEFQKREKFCADSSDPVDKPNEAERTIQRASKHKR